MKAGYKLFLTTNLLLRWHEISYLMCNTRRKKWYKLEMYIHSPKFNFLRKQVLSSTRCLCKSISSTEIQKKNKTLLDLIEHCDLQICINILCSAFKHDIAWILLTTLSFENKSVTLHLPVGEYRLNYFYV